MWTLYFNLYMDVDYEGPEEHQGVWVKPQPVHQA